MRAKGHQGAAAISRIRTCGQQLQSDAGAIAVVRPGPAGRLDHLERIKAARQLALVNTESAHDAIAPTQPPRSGDGPKQTGTRHSDLC